MKTFKEYLSESKKMWSFRIKVAGELPESFQSTIKDRLQKFGCTRFEKTAQTPIQKNAIDFPQLENVEVSMFEVETAYPVTPPEIANIIKAANLIKEEYVLVRYTTEELEQTVAGNESGKSLLADPSYSEVAKIKHKDYFGDDFNKSFLKDLEKTAKARKKELGHDKGKPDVLGSAPKAKEDKAGAKSTVGS
jgi:hypothetical protein